MKRHLWVVEPMIDKEWIITFCAFVTRKEARADASDMEDVFGEKHRIVKYVPQEKAK